VLPLPALAFMCVCAIRQVEKREIGKVGEDLEVLAKKPQAKWWLQLTPMTTSGLTGINGMQSFCPFSQLRKPLAKPLGKLL